MVEPRVKKSVSLDTPIIILAGGQGTRLRAVIHDSPKILAPIWSFGGNGERKSTLFIHVLIKWLEQQGATKLIFSLGYQAQYVIDALSDLPKQQQMTISYHQESTPLGTLGGVANCLTQAQIDDCIVINGDTFVDVNLIAFFAQQKKINSFAGLVAKHVEDVSRFGELCLGQHNEVSRFIEKNNENPHSGWINAGIYYFSRQACQMIKHHECGSLEEDFLIKKVHQLHYFPVDTGRFIDIGTPESYHAASYVLREFL